MSGHHPWSEIKHKRWPVCRRCGEHGVPFGRWCRRCTRTVCCDNYPRLKRRGVFYDAWGAAWPRFVWKTCVHQDRERDELQDRFIGQVDL